MNKSGKILTLAEKCKKILASNFRGQLHTVKSNADTSKDEIHSSGIKYFLRKGRPYVWVSDDDLHNMNTILDERGALSVTSALPGPLMSILKSNNKLPARVAMTGDLVPLKVEKVKLITESVKANIFTEQNAVSHFSYPVTGILSSSTISSNSRTENLSEVIGRSNYSMYKFNIRSLTYIDSHGGAHEMDSPHMVACKDDPLAPFSERLIDGINQNRARRRALMLFCFAFLNVNARDAYMLSVDCKGFDILGKVPKVESKDHIGSYEWMELRFDFQEAAGSIESFCRLLVNLEEEALQNVKSFSGLG